MRFIKNAVIVPLKNKNNEYLLINTLFGLLDVITEKEYSIIKDFQSVDFIDKNDLNDEYLTLFKQLTSRYYVMDASLEKKYEEDLLRKLREENEAINKNLYTVAFVLSYACNFACPYCYEADNDNSQSTSIMTKEQVDLICGMYPQGIQKIILFGGEPLLIRNREIIEYIVQKNPNAYYSVVTNGYYLEEFLDILKTLKIINIQVTLDGDELLHDKSRILKNGQGTFKKIMKGIERCLENGLTIKVRMNITENNIDECLNLRERLLQEYKNNQNLIFELQPVFQIDENKKRVLWDKLFGDVSMNKEEMARKNNILQTFPALTNFFVGGNRIKPIYRYCQLEEQNRYYDPDGLIYSCVLAVGDKEKSIGTYYPKLNFKENSMATRNIENIPECSNCSNKFICGGGCPNAVSGMGDCFKPNCYNFHAEISHMLPYIYALLEGEK